MRWNSEIPGEQDGWNQIAGGAANREDLMLVMFGKTYCYLKSHMVLWRRVMAREFKPVRFFVMMAAAAFIVCGVTAFYTKRAEHGRTSEERQAYWIGENAGEEAPPDAKLPTPAGLNMMAQKYFEQHGSGNRSDWNLAFEHGYEDGFRKTHPQ